MPEPTEDIIPTWDLTDFEFGIKEMIDHLSDIKDLMNEIADLTYKNTEKTTKETTKQVKNSTNNIQKFGTSIFSFIGKIAVLTTMFKGMFGFISSNIPEIGKTFEFSSKIITRNLLFPLRKELIPILQKVLDWVRDNRATFVKWGSVLVNVFRALKTGVSVLFKFLISIGETLKKSLGIKSVSDELIKFLNIVSFKFTAVFLILSKSIKPFTDALEKFLEFSKKTFKAFLEGINAEEIAEVWNKVSKSFSGIIETLGKLFGLFKDNNKEASNFFDIMEKIGTFFSDTLVLVLNDLNTRLENLKSLLEVFTGEKKFSEYLKGFKTPDILKEIGEFITTPFKKEEPEEPAGKRRKKGRDVIISNGEEIIPDSNDTIIATKNPVNVIKNNSNNRSINIENIYVPITVNQSEKPEETGKKAAKGFIEELNENNLRLKGNK